MHGFKRSFLRIRSSGLLFIHALATPSTLNHEDAYAGSLFSCKVVQRIELAALSVSRLTRGREN